MALHSVPSITKHSTDLRPYRIEHESLASLEEKQHPNNPKDHNLGSLIQAILRWGFTSPVMMDEATDTLVAGHGRIQALRAMRNDGYDPPDGITEDERDWFVPVIRGITFSSDHERDAYLVADNAQTIQGGWQIDALTDMLESLAREDAVHGLDGTGYDMNDLDMLLQDKNFTPPPPESPPELQIRFGIWMQVKDKVQENAVADLLAGHGWEKFRRMSEDD